MVGMNLEDLAWAVMREREATANRISGHAASLEPDRPPLSDEIVLGSHLRSISAGDQHAPWYWRWLLPARRRSDA